MTPLGRVLPLALVAIVACTQEVRPAARRAPDGEHARTHLVVIASHPDDEALSASGWLARAVAAGKSVAVVLVTNGDLNCRHDGLKRQAESVTGLAALGVPERRVYFLGYPDGALASLGVLPLPPRRRVVDGVCREGNTTYGARGAGGRDVHSARVGAPAIYSRANAVADLASVLAELEPEHVVITHPQDTHPDHGAAYALFRAALDRLPVAPRVHRAIVHNGDCWPNGAQPDEPCPPPIADLARPMPPLTGRLARYAASERFAVPASWRTGAPAQSPKHRAIAAHVSQTRGSAQSYLFGFVRSDEAFFPETLSRAAGRWRRPGGFASLGRTPIELRLRDGERGAIATAPPLAIAARFGRPTGNFGTVVVRLLEGASGAYVLEIDRVRIEARLFRVGAEGAALLLATWPLAHDLWTVYDTEPFTIAVEPRPEDGPVAEITLFHRDEMVGLTVDVDPRTHGQSLSVSGPASQVVVVR